MTSDSSSTVLATRLQPEVRARFATLSAMHGLTESALLAKLIGEVLRANTAPSADALPVVERVALSDDERVTLRLRKGDRGRALALAEARGVKPGTYLTLLIHNHVNEADVLPAYELDILKSSTARLAALGRDLRAFAAPNTLSAEDLSALRDLMEQLRREVATAREAASDVVKRNLQSWEGAHA